MNDMSTQSFLPVLPRTIGEVGLQSVNARDLHAFLEVRSEFRNWIKNRIDDFGFVENRDFATTVENYRGGERRDYHLSLDMAKELAMVERNEKGKQARQYFIECERRARQPLVADPLENLPPEQRALISMMVAQAEIKRVQDEQGAALLKLGQQVEENAQLHIMLARPAGSETITAIRERINKKYGLPPRIIDEVMRQSLYSLKPAGMVRNAREEAQGSSYAVYWIKDVSMTFSLFTDECEHVTATQATHKMIDGRFKLNAKKDAA